MNFDTKLPAKTSFYDVAKRFNSKVTAVVFYPRDKCALLIYPLSQLLLRQIQLDTCILQLAAYHQVRQFLLVFITPRCSFFADELEEAPLSIEEINSRNAKDFEKLKTKKDKNITIEKFVDIGEIDPIFYDRPYYVNPTGAENAYALLLKAMETEGKAGIAKAVLGNKETLLVLRAYSGQMLVNTLFFADEIQTNGGCAALIFMTRK